MNTRRSSTKAMIRLEPLEERITPVAIDPSFVHLAAHRSAIVAHTRIAHRPEAEAQNGSHLSSHGSHHHHRHEPSPDRMNTHTSPTHHGGGATSSGAPVGSSTSSGSSSSPLPANVSQPLQTIYQEFEAAGGHDSFTSTFRGIIRIEGSSVGVMIHGNGGDFNTLISDMEKLGLQIDATDATTQTIDGLLPIAALPQAAQDPLTLSVTPSFLPRVHRL